MKLWKSLKKFFSKSDETLPVINSKSLEKEGKPDQSSIMEKLKTWNQNFVIDDSSKIYYRWIGILSITILFNIMMLPVRASFGMVTKNRSPAWFVFDYVIDAMNLIDIFIGSRTGFLEQGLLVTENEKLRKHYISKIDFKADLIAIIPFELFSLISKKKNINYIWYRFNRLTKIYRLNEFMNRTDTRTNFPNVFRISSLIIFVLIIIHWNGCFYFFISNSIGLGSDGFVYPPRNNMSDMTISIPVTEPWDQFPSMYMYSFFWSTLTLTTIAEVPKPVLNYEFVIMTIELLSGVLIFATIVGNVSSMISNMSAAQKEFQEKIDGVKRYMELRGVSKELEKRIINWFDYLWTNKQSLDEENVLSTLPEKLRAEISIHVHYDTLKTVSIFQDCEKSLLIQLILKLQLQVFSPGDYICRKGDIGKEMYIVKRGKINVVAEDGIKVFVTLNEGSVLGELSILNIPGSKSGNRRTANVRSVGYSDLFCLNKDDLWDVLDEYPDAKMKLIQRGKEILMKDNLLDLEENKKLEGSKNQDFKTNVNTIDETVSRYEAQISKLIANYESSQTLLKWKLNRIEKKIFFNT